VGTKARRGFPHLVAVWRRVAFDDVDKIVDECEEEEDAATAVLLCWLEAITALEKYRRKNTEEVCRRKHR